MPARWARRLGILGAAVVASLVAEPRVASAQRLGGQRFSPAISEDGVLGTEGAENRRPLFPYVALWLHYALDPVVLVDEDGDEVGALVEHLFAADLVASFNVWAGLELGFGLPVTLVASGDDTTADQAGIARSGGAALGDLRLQVGYRFRLGDATFLALHVPVLLPTTTSDDVLGLGFGVRPTVAFSHGFTAVDLLFNLSYLIRGTVDALDLHGGQELGFRFGMRIGLDRAWDTSLLAELGISTSLHDFFSAATTPLEVRAGIDHWFGDRWRLGAFVGTGFTTGVGAPDLRVGASLAFGSQPRRPRIVPLPGDRDADGVADEADQCPDDPEDADGFEDEDGCPDPDNDRDGRPDVDDQCPSEPESDNGIADDDGCPDLVRVEGTRITTFEPVHFRFGSDEIMPRSHAMLTEIARVMQASPGMRISVEGHTDDAGDEGVNQELSRRRAFSVRRFLVQHGVDGERLTAVGHGESRPLEPNRSGAARSRNRRVEFHIAH